MTIGSPLMGRAGPIETLSPLRTGEPDITAMFQMQLQGIDNSQTLEA